MQHPDGTPYTDAELTAERFRRWAWLGKVQRSAHPYSGLSLPIIKRYAQCELATVAEVIEEMHRHFNKRRFPQGPDGPEVTPPPAGPVTGDPVVYEGVMVMTPDPPPLSKEERDALWEALVERQCAEHPDDPLIGTRVSFTASAYPKDDERELN